MEVTVALLLMVIMNVALQDLQKLLNLDGALVMYTITSSDAFPLPTSLMLHSQVVKLQYIIIPPEID